MENRKLRDSALIFTLILLFWPFFMATSIPQGTVSEQIKAVQEAPFLHIINFIFALAIAPSMLLMLRRLFPFLGYENRKSYLVIVTIFYALYLILISVSYGSQVFWIPFIPENLTENVVAKWFFYQEGSNAILINQAGYLCWSIASLLYFLPVIFKHRGSLLYALIVFIISSLLQIPASMGAFTGNNALSGLTFYSGLLMFPAGLLVFLFALAKKTNQKDLYSV